MAHIAMHDGQLQTIQFNLKQNLKKFLDALRWAEWWLDGLMVSFSIRGKVVWRKAYIYYNDSWRLNILIELAYNM